MLIKTLSEAACKADFTMAAPQPASETARREPLAAKTEIASMDSQHSSMMCIGTWQAVIVAFSMISGRLGSSLGMP